MNIILYKNNLDDNNLDNIMGIMLDIIITKDNNIYTSFNNLSLYNTLLKLNTFKGKIILNLIPLDETILINNYQKVINDNINYVNNVKKIVDNFKNLNIYLASSSYNLLYQIIRLFPNNKKGVLLKDDGSGYIDVDFYIFNSLMLNEKIMKEQLLFDKEVMIIMNDLNDINLVTSFLKKYNSNINNYQYITNYPKIFYNSVYNII